MEYIEHETKATETNTEAHHKDKEHSVVKL